MYYSTFKKKNFNSKIDRSHAAGIIIASILSDITFKTQLQSAIAVVPISIL